MWTPNVSQCSGENLMSYSHLAALNCHASLATAFCLCCALSAFCETWWEVAHQVSARAHRSIVTVIDLRKIGGTARTAGDLFNPFGDPVDPFFTGKKGTPIPLAELGTYKGLAPAYVARQATGPKPVPS